MKKIIFSVVVLSLLISVPAFAKEAKNEEMSGMSMGMPMPGMEKQCGSMAGKAQMVATDEGGVIVLACNKLMKYDADLNLVKEVEIQMPMSPMGGMTGGKQCPMMGKMAAKGSAPVASDSQEKTS